jgi:hypothetical protein
MQRLILALGLLALVTACGVREMRGRRDTLDHLVATNASLAAVEAQLHVHFTVTKKGSPLWSKMLHQYQLYAKDDPILAKMNKAAAVGHTSTIDIQTYVFLDEHDRLLDFELRPQ